MIRQVGLSGLALILGSVAALAVDIDGRWAVIEEACGSAIRNNDAIVEVDTASREIRYYESLCVIGEIQPIGNLGLAWRTSETCSGEGQTWTSEVVYGLLQPFDGTTDQLVSIKLSTGFVSVWYRCGK